jgi:hypothetical protein
MAESLSAPSTPDPMLECSFTRRDYMTTEGQALITDISNLVFDDLNRQVPFRLPGTLRTPRSSMRFGVVFNAKDQHPSAAALYAVSTQLINPLHSLAKGGNLERFQRDYGVTPADHESNRFSFGGGLLDMDFTWHAAPALASSVVNEFVAAGKLTSEQHAAMTLHDWANIIGTGWFSKLTHSLAFTSNGTYRRFGECEKDYDRGGFQRSLGEISINAAKPFVIGEAYEADEGKRYVTATVSGDLKRTLRERINPPNQDKKEREYNSPGCPAARYSTMFFRHMIDTDPHVRNLLARGEMTIDDSRSTEQKVKATQEYTSIDRALMVLAVKLDQYEDMYGMPQVTRVGTKTDRVRVAHISAEPVDALRYDASE